MMGCGGTLGAGTKRKEAWAGGGEGSGFSVRSEISGHKHGLTESSFNNEL